jgi:hypothetical protein
VDPDELEPDRIAQLTVETGFFGDGRTLRSVLHPETWELFEERLEREGLAPDAFVHMEPWLAGMTLQLVALEREGFDPDRGVDMALARSAGLAGKRIAGLETADAQIAALDSLPLPTQELMLRDVLEEEDPEAGLPALLDAWRKGDAACIEATVFAGLGADPALDPFFEALYFERNRQMARGIAELVDRGGLAFVVVGAGHVVGSRGVPALLAADGYAVRRLPKTPAR